MLAERPPRAGGFIVTLYGDVVVPRGGVLWIGSIIEACAEVGISETLVRTAVSRLVAAGRLVGERAGRLSFYRLTEAALSEFVAAAAVLFGGAEPATDWQLVAWSGGADPIPSGPEAAGFARLGPGLALAPWGRRGAGPALVLRVSAPAGTDPGGLRAFAAAHWPLAAQAEAWREFLRRFEPLAGAGLPSGRDCLTARLVLVDAFRRAALADPGLPAGSLPADWPGAEARALFAWLYLALSPRADAFVAERFVARDGPLGTGTAEVEARRTGLARMLGAGEKHYTIGENAD